MPHTYISVRRVTLAKETLASLSAAERSFLFLAGHIANELNTLNKVFGWCLHSHPEEMPSRLNSLAQGVQALVYARTLAGKIYEAWGALRNAWFRNKLTVQLQPLLHADATAALDSLKTYFGRPNPINRIRNSLAFHYSGDALSEHWEDAVQDDTPYDVIFGGTRGNNLHLGAELVANAALLRVVGTGNSEQSLQIFFDDVHRMAGHMVTFLEGASLLITERALGQAVDLAASEESLAVTQAYSEVFIPYFCRPDHEGA